MTRTNPSRSVTEENVHRVILIMTKNLDFIEFLLIYPVYIYHITILNIFFFPQEVNFVVLKAGDSEEMLLRSVERLLSNIFVPAVRLYPSDLDSSPGAGSARDHLLAGLRSFASCLHGL